MVHAHTHTQYMKNGLTWWYPDDASLMWFNVVECCHVCVWLSLIRIDIESFWSVSQLPHLTKMKMFGGFFNHYGDRESIRRRNFNIHYYFNNWTDRSDGCENTIFFFSLLIHEYEIKLLNQKYKTNYAL